MSYGQSSFPVMRVFIVRHGETNENRQGIIQGQMDTVLNQDGVIQAHLCAEALKNVQFDAAISSDLKRATQTAEIILSRRPNVKLIKNQELRERNMGELSGIKVGSYDKLGKMPKSVETSQQFIRRAIEWWINTIERNIPLLPIRKRPCNVLVVSHGAYITTLCHELVISKRVDALPNVFLGSCFNTSVTTVAVRRDQRGTLEKFADISHLLMRAEVVSRNADEIPDGKVEDTKVEVDGKNKPV